MFKTGRKVFLNYIRNHARLFAFLYFILASTWIFGPYVNSLLKLGPNLISEFESFGQPYAIYFRCFDFLSAAILVLGILAFRRIIQQKYGQIILLIFYLISALIALDALVPITCSVVNGICQPVNNFSMYVHGAESFLVSGLVLLTSAFIAYKYKKIIWAPIVLLLTVILGFIANYFGHHTLYFLQLINTFIFIFWLQQIIFIDNAKPINDVVLSKNIRFAIAAWACFQIFVYIFTIWLHISVGDMLEDAWVANNTAWLAQHAIFMVAMLIYLTRHLLRGEKISWIIFTIIIFGELIKFSSLYIEPVEIMVYLMLFAALSIVGFAFDRSTSFSYHKKLFKILLPVLVLASATILLAFLFRIFNRFAWEHSLFTPWRVAGRTLLLNVAVDNHEPIKARIFAQVLSAIGIIFYFWIAFSIFTPKDKLGHFISRKGAKKIIENHSNSSEDYFKIWPTDKQYWQFNSETVIAYKIVGKIAYALADPIGKDPWGAMTEFKKVCRDNGLIVTYLMVDEYNSKKYKESDFKLIQVGASAEINIDKFTLETVKNKWWRWIRNKNKKLGLSYEKILQPKNFDLYQLAKINKDWLDDGQRQERGFALGYYDEEYMKNSIVHVLKDETGKIVAFANQLPTFNNSKTVSIDLMRSYKAYGGSVSFLLSEMLINFKEEGKFSVFDLGFVPLASNSTISKQSQLIQALIKPVFSAKGLVQFKDKFEPVWKANYIAWDGDSVDIMNIAKNMNKLLKL